MRSLDDRLFFAINRFARGSDWLHQPALAYATYGVVLFAVLLGLALWRNRHSSSESLAVTGWTAIATMLALGLNQPIGNVVNEARPYVTHRNIFLLAQRTGDFSFPSDHAVMTGAVAAGLLIAWRPAGLVAAGAALLMALARVYVGAHYPWDVLAGLAVGAVVSVGGWTLLRKPLVALTDWLRSLEPLRVVFGPELDVESVQRDVGDRA